MLGKGRVSLSLPLSFFFFLGGGSADEAAQRYVYPLVAPPTPERLEQDKKSIEEQFYRAFALVEQLAKDTEALRSAERQRTEKLDSALADLEATMADVKAANRRREDDGQRIRDEVQALKDAIPKAMDSQKKMADGRLAEISSELASLKTLVKQRMTAAESGGGGGNGSGAARASIPAWQMAAAAGAGSDITRAGQADGGEQPDEGGGT